MIIRLRSLAWVIVTLAIAAAAFISAAESRELRGSTPDSGEPRDLVNRPDGWTETVAGDRPLPGVPTTVSSVPSLVSCPTAVATPPRAPGGPTLICPARPPLPFLTSTALGCPGCVPSATRRSNGLGIASTAIIIPASSCGRMWQWNTYLPSCGLTRNRISTLPSGGMLIVSRSDAYRYLPGIGWLNGFV